MMTKHCSQCGSDWVGRRAWVVWDETTQKWVIDSIFDFAYCDDCQSETTIVDSIGDNNA